MYACAHYATWTILNKLSLNICCSEYNESCFEQVRDVLNGTLRFSRNIMDDEAEININDNHYDLSATPDSDEIGGLATGKHLANSDSVSKYVHKTIFYDVLIIPL